MGNDWKQLSVALASLSAVDMECIRGYEDNEEQAPVVATSPSIGLLENDLDENIEALHGLQQTEQAIGDNDLTPATAQAVSASLEMFKIQLRLPSVETFATNSHAATFYASEAVQAKQQTIFERIVDFFVQWGKSVMEWIRALVDKRKGAEKALAFVTKELPTIDAIVVKPNAFQARGLISSVASFEGSDCDAMVQESANSMDALSEQIRKLRNATSAMFRETTTDEAGALRSIGHSHALALFFKDNPTFNSTGLGGAQWFVSSAVLARYEGGDTLPKFTVEQETVERNTVEGTISADALTAAVKTAKVALQTSESLMSGLESYAKKLSAMKAKGLASSGKVTIDGKAKSANTAVLMCLSSMASTIRSCASLYDSCVVSYAMDCARAVKYAKRKA